MIKYKNHDNISAASQVKQLDIMWQTQQRGRICFQLPVFLLVFLPQDKTSQKSSLSILRQKSSEERR